MPVIKLELTKVSGNDKEGFYAEEFHIKLDYRLAADEAYEDAIRRMTQMLHDRFAQQHHREADRLPLRTREAARWQQLGLWPLGAPGESRDDENPLNS